jgi:hypothetical protein
MPARKCSVVTANDPGPGALPDSHAAALPEMLQYEVPCKITMVLCEYRCYR